MTGRFTGKFVVTGGAGFIGSHVAEAALAAGYRVYCCDDLSRGRKENVPHGAEFLEMDVSSVDFGEFLRRTKPDIVSHHAAQVDVRRAIEEPAYDAEQNILGLISVLDACVGAGVPRVVFASSGGAVYGEQQYFPAAEDHPVAPLSPYGITKATGEMYLDFFRRLKSLDTVSLRYANVYGPRQDAEGDAGVVAIFCGAALGQRDARIFGDGEQTRDYVFVSDVAKANILACSPSVGPGPFNIATGVETSVNDLWRKIASLSGVSRRLEHTAAIDGEVRRSCLDASRAAAGLGWTPTVSLDEGLALTLEWFGRHGSSS